MARLPHALSRPTRLMAGQTTRPRQGDALRDKSAKQVIPLLLHLQPSWSGHHLYLTCMALQSVSSVIFLPYSGSRSFSYRLAQGASPDQLVDHRVEIIFRDPFDHRDADRVAEAEERLIHRRGNFVIIRAHQPGAFARREEAREILALACLE